jgi:hypothetical protein
LRYNPKALQKFGLVLARLMSWRCSCIMNAQNMLSISLMKVAGAFVNLKGMTIHSKRLSLDLKVVFHTSDGLNWYLVIPKLQVDLAEIFCHF